jgi:hypothetical protein
MLVNNAENANFISRNSKEDGIGEPSRAAQDNRVKARLLRVTLKIEINRV